MRKCVLIGGYNKSITGNDVPNIIDKKITELAGKEKPVFLFIGLASSHSDSQYDKMKKIYQKLNCTTVYLKKNNLIHNPDLVKKKIAQADIIYIGGGDSIKLASRIDEFGLEILLREAYDRGCVLVGVSAGAILLSKEGFSDSNILRGESEDFLFVKGMGFVKTIICPHYGEDRKRICQLKESIKNTKTKVYGISNDASLVIINDQIEVISFNRGKVFQISYDDTYKESEVK